MIVSFNNHKNWCCGYNRIIIIKVSDDWIDWECSRRSCKQTDSMLISDFHNIMRNELGLRK